MPYAPLEAGDFMMRGMYIGSRRKCCAKDVLRFGDVDDFGKLNKEKNMIDDNNAANIRAGEFNPEKLRLSQDFGAAFGVKKVLTNVPVRRPDKQWFVRVHPGEGWHLEVAIIEMKEDNENFIVDPKIAPELAHEAVAKVLFTAITRQGLVFLWPVRLPGPDGKLDDWNRSALQAVERAREDWVRVVANKQAGGYELMRATGSLPEAEWPQDLTFADVLGIAFKGRVIKSLDHPVLKKLQGAT